MHLFGFGFDHKERHKEEKTLIRRPFDVPYLRRRIAPTMLHQPSLREVWFNLLPQGSLGPTSILPCGRLCHKRSVLQ